MAAREATASPTCGQRGFATMSNRDNIPPEQAFRFDCADRNARAIALLGDNICYFGELGMEEFETAGRITGLLEQGGFAVECGIVGFPTGFCASFGSGSSVECFKSPASWPRRSARSRTNWVGLSTSPCCRRSKKPPVDLDRALMDKFRPAMARYYLKELPEFR